VKNALKAGSVGCWLQMGRWAGGQVLCKNWQKCHQCIRDRNNGSPGQEVTEGWQCAWFQLVPDWAIAFSLCAWGRWWQSACQGEFLQFRSGLVLMVFKIFTLRDGPPGWLALVLNLASSTPKNMLVSKLINDIYVPGVISCWLIDGSCFDVLQVSLVSIPSREELRQKNLFSVSDCKMYWQSSGEYLAVKVYCLLFVYFRILF
jgi:hypothetical protein